MNDLGNRLDALASEATASTVLSDPSRAGRPATSAPSRRPRLAPARIAFGFGLASLLVVVGMLTWWQVRSQPSSSLVVASELGSRTTGECSTPNLTQLLGTGVPDGDYERANWYAELADQSSVVVSGKIASAQRVAVGGTDYIELSVVDLVDSEATPRPDITTVAYSIAWPAETEIAHPLDSGLVFDEVAFVGFLSPWSGVRGGWTPGRQGLYVACAADQPVRPVLDSAAGPDDPEDATAALVRQLMGSREALVAGLRLTPVSPESPPPVLSVEARCSAATVAAMIASASPVFDPLPYPVVSSFDMLAQRAPEVVSGRVVGIRLIVVAQQFFAALAVEDVVDLKGAAVTELTTIVYQIPRDLSKALSAMPNQGWALEDMVFVGFLGPVAGGEDVPAIRTPGPQGLYLTCGDDPLLPVVESAAGPDDPQSLTVAELLALVTDD